MAEVRALSIFLNPLSKQILMWKPLDSRCLVSPFHVLCEMKVVAHSASRVDKSVDVLLGMLGGKYGIL